MNNKNTNSHLHLKLAIPLFVILFLLFAVQTLFSFILLQRIQSTESYRISNLINQSIDALNRDLPIEPKTGVAFIKEAGLTLPPIPENVGYVTYSYQRPNEDFKAILHLARKNDISAAKSAMTGKESIEEALDQVPRLQACSRGVSISYDEKDIQQAAGSKQLANGKTVYFSTEPLCNNENLLIYAKQVDSYN